MREKPFHQSLQATRHVQVTLNLMLDRHLTISIGAHRHGAVARSTASDNCCDIVLATRRRITSPATMPRTPPSGFDNALSRPTLSTATWRTRALASREPNAVKSCMPLVSSSKGRRCSEGPPAAPRRDVRKFRANICSSSSNMATGSHAVTSVSNPCARRSPFAKSATSRACRANESSPIWIRVSALGTGLSKSKPPVLRHQRRETAAFSSQASLDMSKALNSPRLKASNRPSKAISTSWEAV